MAAISSSCSSGISVVSVVSAAGSSSAAESAAVAERSVSIANKGAEVVQNTIHGMDTIREQGNVYLTAGTVLLSNECNPMLEIVADTCGRHDTLGGACATESNTVRNALEKKCMHACRDSWLLAVTENEEFGMSKRAITHNINFFMNVPITADGKLTFEDGISDAGKYVELKAMMDVIVLISNCPQLNNPCNAYNPTPIEVLIWQ